MENRAAPNSFYSRLSGPEFYWAFAIALLAVTLSRLIPVVVNQLGAPFDLVYESPNLTTIRAIQSGKSIYDPDLYLKPPFTLTIYTPFYHYLVAMLPASGENPFLTGRLVAMVFLVLAGATLLLVEANKPGGFFGVIGLSLYFLVWPVTSNTAIMKNDSAALFFSALAVIIVARGTGTAWRIVLAAFFCALALASKQSYGAATVACFVFFLLNRRNAAWVFLASFSVFFAVFFIGGYWVWGEGFWFSIIGAVQQPMAWDHFSDVLGKICRQPLFVVVFGSFAVGVFFDLFRTGQFPRSPYGCYGLVSWGVFLASLGRLGSSTNYVLEPCLASLLFVVAYLKSSTLPSSRRVAGLSACGVLALLVLVDLHETRLKDYSFLNDTVTLENRIRAISNRNTAIATIHQKPRILNLAYAHLTGELPGEVSINDPALYYLLWLNDRLSEEGLVRSLEEQYFDLLVVVKEFVANVSEERLKGKRWQRVIDAILENYPVIREGPDFIFLLPMERAFKQ